MKALVEVTYHRIGEEELEELEITSIPFIVSHTWKDAVTEELNTHWQEMVLSVVPNIPEYEEVHTTVFSVNLSYQTDHWGEVDLEWEAEMIATGQTGVITIEGHVDHLSEPEPSPDSFETFKVVGVWG